MGNATATAGLYKMFMLRFFLNNIIHTVAASLPGFQSFKFLQK
jgi:hypothetical protein